MSNSNNYTLYKIICTLKKYWINQGCFIIQGLDLPIGAGTFHPQTFLNAIGPLPASVAYVQACRRPSDGRFGNNPNRLQHYYQFQVIIKPPPKNIQEIYINSLKKLTINPKHEDLKFIEDDWKNPTLGASGVGWEVWINGMEITQFTYFQQIGSLDCNPVTVEITYGLERLAMHLQNIDNILKIKWMHSKENTITYKDLFFKNEQEQSSYNFLYSDIKLLLKFFHQHIKEADRLLNLKNPLLLPAYEHILQASHNFNLIDAKKILSVIERQHYIFVIRNLTKKVAVNHYLNQTKK